MEERVVLSEAQSVAQNRVENNADLRAFGLWTRSPDFEEPLRDGDANDALRWAGPPELWSCTGNTGLALVRLALEVGVGAFDEDGSLHVLEAEATVCFD
eukprot:15899713-Heterocapsa_arctica.AAC.1